MTEETAETHRIHELEECIRDFIEVTDWVDPSNMKMLDARTRAAELIPDIRGYPNSITKRHVNSRSV